MSEFGLALIKQEGGWYFPYEPELSNFMNLHPDDPLVLDIERVIKRLMANQRKRPGRKKKETVF